MFPPNISGRVGLHPRHARGTGLHLVRRRLGGVGSAFTICSAQFTAAVRKFCIAIPKIGTVNSLAPVEYQSQSRSFVRTEQLFFRRNILNTPQTMTNDETRQRSALFAEEWWSQGPRQKERIANGAPAPCVYAPSLQRFPGHRSLSIHRSSAAAGRTPAGEGDNAPTPKAFASSALQPRAGFTLLELLIVVGIIGLLLVLIAPAFTTIKGGTDVTSAAYTIKGALDTARTYAKANNTYAWVGFSGSIGSTVTGSVALSVVASKDGTDLGTSVNQVGNRIDITMGVTPIGKVTRLNNAHIGDTGTPTNNGTDFESRPAVNINYRIGASGTQYNSDYYFIEQGTQFDRWIRFNPRGETVVKGGLTQITQYAEVGLLPTHGTTLAATINPASGNLVAIQISGFAGDVRIYRR
jgi:prepilin-type N-terminal cleavage/methylation domain-containing protein